MCSPPMTCLARGFLCNRGIGDVLSMVTRNRSALRFLCNERNGEILGTLMRMQAINLYRMAVVLMRGATEQKKISGGSKCP